MVKLVFS